MSRLWPHGSIFINNSWLDNPHPVAAHPIYAQGFVFLLDERNPYSEHPEKGKIGPSQLIRGQDRRGVSNANPPFNPTWNALPSSDVRAWDSGLR
jgi:hypothetical protein